MLLIVGDTRVQHIEKAFVGLEREKLDPICLSKPGARIPHILDLLTKFREENEKKVPAVVVIVGMIGDILLKKTVPAGHTTFEMREEAQSKGQEYPALGGIVKMRMKVEGKLESMWPGVRTLWVLPFPVDLTAFVRYHATVPISRHVECSINKVTLAVNNYMSAVDKKFQRGEMDLDVIPWFHIWKEASSQAHDAPCEFREFMGRLRKGERVPPLCPDSTLDGLYPRIQTSQGLIRAVGRKYRYTLAQSRKASASLPPLASVQEPVSTQGPVPAQASALPTPQEAVLKGLVSTMDRACQVDDGMERVPKVLRRILLPCFCLKTTIEESEGHFECGECGEEYPKTDLYLHSYISVYKYNKTKKE